MPSHSPISLLKYFEALSRSDINTFVSCFTPEAAPDQATQDALKRVFSLETIGSSVTPIPAFPPQGGR